jgi:magnesium-transporting ATPase (P-type)
MSSLPSATDLSPKVIEFISHGASINSTSVIMDNDGGEQFITGSKTEGALLVFLKNQLQVDYKTIRNKGFDSTRGDRLYTFSSIRKCMSVLIKNGNKGILV